MGDTTCNKELPQDCWELILKRIGHGDYRDLESPSLVCKQFLSITDRLRRKLVAKNEVFYRDGCEALCRALDRFRNLKKIKLSRCPFDGDKEVVEDIDRLILKIASSGLDLQALDLYWLWKCPSAESLRKLGSTMKNLKILRLGDFMFPLRDCDLVAIADALPWLEELDINNLRHQISTYSVTDAGIEVISRKLCGLRKIDISWHQDCSDLSLFALSSNCALLNEIRWTKCNITQHGVFSLLHHSPNLVSLQAGYCKSLPDSSLAFDSSKIRARALRLLHLCLSENQDRILRSIAEACIPLENLLLWPSVGDCGLTLNGLSTFLRACPSLKYLELCCINFLNDHIMRDLCQYLPSLVSIELSHCPHLTYATFFIVAKGCPVLSKIKLSLLSQRSFEIEDDVIVMDVDTNYRIRSLDLSSNSYLNDELLKEIVLTCPNLHTLDVRECFRLTKEGIGEIMKCCPQVKHFRVSKYMEAL